MELRAPTATLTLLGDRHTHAPYGVFGGHPGKRAETLLVRDGGTESFGSKEVVELRGGDVVRFRLAGAGGHGDPRERDGDAVRDDVAARRTSSVRCPFVSLTEFRIAPRPRWRMREPD